MPNLQIRVLREVYLGGGVGPTRFGEHLSALLQEEFRDCPIGGMFYDPSADYGADKEGGESTWIEIIRRAVGADIPCLPAWTNEIAPRVEAVRNLLVLPITAEIRGLLVDPRCTWLIRGFSGKYRYKLTPDGQVINAGAPRPEKNDFGHPHDALQYAILGMVGRAGVIQAAAKGYRPGELGGPKSGNIVMKSEFAL